MLLVNQQATPDELPLTLTHFKAFVGSAGQNHSNGNTVRIQVFRTSFAENVALLLDQTLALPSSISIRLEALSLTTVLISGVVPP